MSDGRRLAIVTSGTGKKVYVEVSSASPPTLIEEEPGFAPASAGAVLTECFESLEETIDNTCEMILEGITRMAKRATPSKVTAELSFELGGEGNIWFVAKSNAKAAIKVTVEWEPHNLSAPPTS